MLHLFLVFQIFFFSVCAMATSLLPRMERVSAQVSYVPAGFDSNDRVQLMVEGSFRDSCLRVGPYTKVVSAGRITLHLSAYRYDTGCMDVMVPFSQSIDVGILPHGNYLIVDGASGKAIGRLPVKATTKAEPDDFLYAPVRDINIAYGYTKNAIQLSGAFFNSCMKIKEVKAFMDGDRVVTVLPMAEILPGPCTLGYFPYNSYASYPQGTKGKNLIHVRSLSGQALLKLIELPR